MARKKVNLAWIANDSTRRVTFKKRRKGLIKKVSELSTLCDVKACIVVYGPKEPEPVAWPSAPEARRVLAQFRGMPEMEQSKKMMNQEGFLRQRIAKLREQLGKQERENRELESSLLLRQGLAGKNVPADSIEEATSLCWSIDTKLKLVYERMAQLTMPSLPLPLPQQQQHRNGAVFVRENSTPMEAIEREKWLLETTLPQSAAEQDHLLLGNGGEEFIPASYCSNPWLDPYFVFN
ncbi:hypothetical protein Cni_G15439 [Canna indica]|uniref:MADS-box domain-containing protein n=1 Tax=Canna indica TaxID=4628 RepID=A0AAQ3QFR0_9LILI|nr:hypothetical protein Cni_G15439 [Canna indica]